ncbi:MAG: sterol desaturase family protein [Myxococcales bacterium]|nr:MAG: sterol desaturase family protein [Myxococcales bacterium]
MSFFAITKECKQAIDSWSGIQSAPSKENRKHPQGITVLQHPFVERYLGKSHWALPGLWFLPIIAYCFYATNRQGHLGLTAMAALFVAGILVWTFVEYMLHRFLFHLNGGDGGFRKSMLFMAHGYHHEFPNDPGRLVAPPMMSWPLAAVFATLFYFTLGMYWLPTFAGFVAGYLAYDWVHYYTHHGRPTTRVGKFLRRYHFEHHYKNHDTQFGISTPLWDLVLGTFRKPGALINPSLDCDQPQAALKT